MLGERQHVLRHGLQEEEEEGADWSHHRDRHDDAQAFQVITGQKMKMKIELAVRGSAVF